MFAAGVCAVCAGWTLLALSCDDEHRRTDPGSVPGSGGACEAKPGELPAPDCDNSAKSCSNAPGCTIDEARCGATSTCLPIGDNAGKSVLDLRLRRLNIATPAALAGPFIQNTIVNSGIELAEKSCAETGRGLFSWIMRIDRAARTVVTGGAPPSTDPLGRGFCFADFELAKSRTKIAPITLALRLEGDRFDTVDHANVNIPIFLSDQLSSAIVLPIRAARIQGVTLSADGNCIGAFNAAALDPACTEDRDLCQKWTTAGSLGGFITLEEADTVTILDLNNKSLCAFLASDSGLTCARDADGSVRYKGDFCSKDQRAGSCQDSVWLGATFAASAAKIFDGHGTVEGCSGATAGTDAGIDAAQNVVDASGN